MAARKRRQGFEENDQEIQKQIFETENVLSTVQLDAERQFDLDLTAANQKLSDDFNKLVKNLDQDLSDEDLQNIANLTGKIDDDFKRKEKDLLDDFRSRQRRRKKRKQADIHEIHDSDDVINHELAELDKQFELEELHFIEKVQEDLTEQAYQEKQSEVSDYLNKNLKKNGAEAVKLIEALENQQDQLYARHLKNKRSMQENLRAKIEARRKEKLSEMDLPKPDKAPAVIESQSDYRNVSTIYQMFIS